MFVTAVVVTLLLATVLVLSAGLKLSHRPRVVEGYLKVGVPENKLNHLAAILLAGAAGLVAGLWWAPLGVAAAIGVVCYFLGAISFHLRARDFAGLPRPVTLAVLGAAVLALRLATL